jgi:hypothetical protein
MDITLEQLQVKKLELSVEILKIVHSYDNHPVSIINNYDKIIKAIYSNQ